MERHSRTIAKTLTWRVIATLTTIGVIYLFDKDVKNSIVIGISANLIKMFLYYLHERLWNRITFGRIKSPDYSI